MSASYNIIKCLSDGEFHSNKELSRYTWRFGGRLHELKQKGFVFEKKGNAKTEPNYIEYWKLISSPNYTVKNGRIMTDFGKIKRIVRKCERLKPKLTLWERIKLFF